MLGKGLWRWRMHCKCCQNHTQMPGSRLTGTSLTNSRICWSWWWPFLPIAFLNILVVSCKQAHSKTKKSDYSCFWNCPCSIKHFSVPFFLSHSSSVRDGQMKFTLLLLSPGEEPGDETWTQYFSQGTFILLSNQVDRMSELLVNFVIIANMLVKHLDSFFFFFNDKK